MTDINLDIDNIDAAKARDLFAYKIAEIAIQIKLARPDAVFTGPDLLMFADDIKLLYAIMEDNINLKSDFIEATLNDMAQIDELLDNILSVAEGHGRSTAYNDGVNIALQNIANMIRVHRS